MRVDRFLEARFPGLSFFPTSSASFAKARCGSTASAPSRRPGWRRDRRCASRRCGSMQPKPRAPGNEADEKTRAFLKSITLYEDADVLVLNKPMGLAVQGGSGTTRHLDGMWRSCAMPTASGRGWCTGSTRIPRQLLLVAKTRFAASALAKTFRSRSARKIYWALVASVPKVQQGRISTYLVKEEREDKSLMRIARHGEKGASHAVTYYAVVETSGATVCLGSRSSRSPAARISCAPTWRTSIIRSSATRNTSQRENWELPGGMQNKLHLLARRIVCAASAWRGDRCHGAIAAAHAAIVEAARPRRRALRPDRRSARKVSRRACHGSTRCIEFTSIAFVSNVQHGIDCCKKTRVVSCRNPARVYNVFQLCELLQRQLHRLRCG